MDIMLSKEGYSYSYKRLQFQKAFLQVFVKLGNVKQTCKAIGLNSQTFYGWQWDDPEFSHLVKKALDLHFKIKIDSINEIDKAKQIQELLSALETK